MRWLPSVSFSSPNRLAQACCHDIRVGLQGVHSLLRSSFSPGVISDLLHSFGQSKSQGQSNFKGSSCKFSSQGIGIGRGEEWDCYFDQSSIVIHNY